MQLIIKRLSKKLFGIEHMSRKDPVSSQSLKKIGQVKTRNTLSGYKLLLLDGETCQNIRC